MTIRLFRAAAAVSALVAFSSFSLVRAESWRDIDPADFALTQSEIDPGFGAEILFSEEKYVQTEIDGELVEKIDRYIRFRIYNEQGVAQLADWKLVFDRDDGTIRNIEGRTVKPDGREYALSEDQIFATKLLRDGQRDISAKSFAFPNVEPGDIVELQYSVKNEELDWVPILRFQERLPARRIFKRIMPLRYPGIGSTIARFNFPEADLSKKELGFFVFEKTNVEAFVDEPYSFPDNSLIPTIILYYYNTDSDGTATGEKYWAELAREMHNEGKRSFKPSKEIQALADELTKGLTKDWSKLGALYDYCQDKLVNLNYSRGTITDKARAKIKEKGKPQDTLSRGNGWPDEITGLFGALAKAAGFEPRWAALHDNRFVRFQAWMSLDFVMKLRYVALEVDGTTRFFRPGNPFLPCGDIEWFAADAADAVVLQAKAKNGELELVSMPDASYSLRRRSLTGTIDEQGTLKASVEIALSGHTGWDAKERLSILEGIDDRKDYFTDQLKKLMPQARFENVEVKNRGSHTRPLLVTYEVEIPDYADVTSKRIYFQPYVFGKGAQDVFVRDKRNSPLLFNYPYSSEDEITITLPEGFALEEGSAPPPLNLRDFGSYEIDLKASKSGKVMYKRSFRQNLHVLPLKAYDPVKAIFNQINIRDQHALGFKRVDAQ